MPAEPPPELYQIGLDREHFVRADHKSWRGPCPRCGGVRRLLIFTDHPFPKWNCQCDACGLHAWADQLEPAVRQPASVEERARWAERNRREREERAARRQAKLMEFTASELWEALHAKLSAEHRAQWERWGVPAEWQDHLQLGWTPDKTYRGVDGDLHHSTAYTIPYFHTNFEFLTLQYRLSEPPTPTDRYRFEQGLGTTYYQAEPANPIGERAVIVEGAKKAMVAHIYGQPDAAVLAVPSKADFGGVVEAVKDCEVIYVLLDPDADARARKLAADIGPAARLATLPGKVDDVILGSDRGKSLFAAALRWARPI